jgi:hypothetical protein
MDYNHWTGKVVLSDPAYPQGWSGFLLVASLGDEDFPTVLRERLGLPAMCNAGLRQVLDWTLGFLLTGHVPGPTSFSLQSRAFIVSVGREHSPAGPVGEKTHVPSPGSPGCLHCLLPATGLPADRKHPSLSNHWFSPANPRPDVFTALEVKEGEKETLEVSELLSWQNPRLAETPVGN